jgi:hypothetical protein
MSAHGASPPSASDSTGADDPRFARLSVELAKIAAAQAAQAAVLASVSASLQELLAAREETRKALLASREETRELRDELLVPLRVAVREERNREQRAHNFISALIVTAQNGFGRDVAPFLALCRETRGEEVLWDAVKDIPSPEKKRTRLMYAAKVGDVGRLRWLLARGAQIGLQDVYGSTALYIASRLGHLEVVRELLARGAAVNTANSDGITPLYAASFQGHLEVVRELLTRGAAVNAATKISTTPLMSASFMGRLEVVRELLACGADPTLENVFGETALHHAKGHAAIVQLLRAALGT